MWSAAGWGECEDGATPPPPRRRAHRVPMVEAASTVEEKAGAVAAVAEVLVVAAAMVEAAVTARVPVADVVSSAEPSVELMEPSVEMSVVSSVVPSVELSGVTSIVSSVETGRGGQRGEKKKDYSPNRESNTRPKDMLKPSTVLRSAN